MESYVNQSVTTYPPGQRSITPGQRSITPSGIDCCLNYIFYNLVND